MPLVERAVHAPLPVFACCLRADEEPERDMVGRGIVGAAVAGIAPPAQTFDLLALPAVVKRAAAPFDDVECIATSPFLLPPLAEVIGCRMSAESFDVFLPVLPG